MKKFVLIHYGFVPPTPEIGAAWGKWFQDYGSMMVDNVGPLMGGKEVKDGQVTDLPLGPESITGMSIVNAASWDEAMAMAKANPAIHSCRVYEQGAM
jgi:hypothetical protein